MHKVHSWYTWCSQWWGDCYAWLLLGWVGGGIFREPIPRIIRRIDTGASTRSVPMIPIKIDAVIPRVGKDTVQNETNAKTLRFFRKRIEVLIRAEQRVDGSIVRRVVPMIAVCAEDGIQVDTIDPQIF